MKTTIEIPDALFREAKEYAARHGLALREVVERGLRAVVHGEVRPARRFRLKTLTTKGQGVAGGADWATISSKIYESHGG
jgi:hypothetical protein